MGTDIRIFVERRGESGWKPVEPPAPWGPPGSLRWQFERCYECFSLLSGVRDPNGRIVPVSKPRGLPPDLSEQVRAEILNLRLIHVSWLSAPEFLAVDVDQPVAYEGYVDVQGFREFLAVGRPATWTPSLQVHAAPKLSNEDMRRVIDQGTPTEGTPYTWLEWKQPLRLLANELLDFMERLRKAGDPRELRAIFGYDYV